MKSIGIVPMLLRTMPLKHGGMVPTPSGSRGLRRGGHHVQGGFIETAGTKNYAGIKYSLRPSLSLPQFVYHLIVVLAPVEGQQRDAGKIIK